MRTNLVFTVLICFQPCCIAADWPQWRGPARDCQIEAQTPWPKSLDEKHLKKIWEMPLEPSYSGPIVHGNRVFVTETRDESHEVVRALDRSTGEELWKVEWPGAISVPFFARANGSWIRSTPATDGKHLFVAGIRDVLVCLNNGNGQEVWRVDFAKTLNADLPSFGTVCSPLIDGEDVYIQAAGSVVKLRKSDGKIRWRAMTRVSSLFGSAMQSSAFSSPVIATLDGTRQLIVQSRNSLMGVDLQSGNKLWSVDIPAFRGMNILTPLVRKNTIFTSSYGGGSFMFEVSKQENEFRVRQIWQTAQQGYMSSPVMIGGDIYLHLRNERFTCVDPDSGESRWTTRPCGKYWSMAVNGSQILSLDQSGKLRLIEADGESYRELDARQLGNLDTWAHIGVADSEVFIRQLDKISVWSWQDAVSR